MLTSQLGTQFAKEIAKELSNTLFGPAQPASPAKDLQSPYALTNVIKNQLYHLRLEDDKSMTTKVIASFKEAMKINEVPSAFLLKLMEPASLFIYTGLIYGNRGLKKPVDIPI